MMQRSTLVAVVIAIAIMSAPVAVNGQGRGRGHAKGNESAEAANSKADDAVAIDRAGHVRVIHEYQRSGSLPPGLAKRDELPPGLRKQLREKGELPPGLEKRLVPVPPDLEVRLPRVPSYDRRYFAGRDLIIIDVRTNHIDAIITGVWR